MAPHPDPAALEQPLDDRAAVVFLSCRAYRRRPRDPGGPGPTRPRVGHAPPRA
ncbi:hypothetical protein GCM10017668_56230 [Streptomyces tuirus]|uniref:Uncharacterized protein n=1 Tax=Streptomyces tuirus TaxID=68278 RepID=A0A7G1NQ12_9ACTN|nr:hypothetical protein GCM10017668_56230 [Streptomyces tuirus]